MRILFMGTPDFASASLERLYEEGHDICGVFTQPDKPQNRGMKLEMSETKKVALAHGTPVYQPVTLRKGKALADIKELAPELIVVVAYGKLLPKSILDYPEYGCINIHGSLLPKFRGAAPVQWAVLSGEKESGVTAMYLSEEMDAGDIIACKRTDIKEKETSGQLYERLKALGAELLAETVSAIENGTASRTPQDEAQVSFAPMLSKEMSPIDWNGSADKILSQIYGLNPWPVATAAFGGVTLKIFDADKCAENGGKAPGEIVSADQSGLVVACANGAIRINELQAPGKKRMKAADYLRGHKLI